MKITIVAKTDRPANSELMHSVLRFSKEVQFTYDQCDRVFYKAGMKRDDAIQTAIDFFEAVKDAGDKGDLSSISLTVSNESGSPSFDEGGY